MRDLCKVINEMLPEIPGEGPNGLRRGLLRILGEVFYTAPECQQRAWAEVGMLLETCFPPPDKLENWQKKVAEIFTMKKF